MSDDIIDLDVLVGHKTVRLAGQTYRLPPDIPVPLILHFEHLAGQDITDDNITDLYQRVLDLFRIHQPDLQELPLTVTQLVTLIPQVYAAASDDRPDPTPAATATATGGTASTPSSRPRRPRSSRSPVPSASTSAGDPATG